MVFFITIIRPVANNIFFDLGSEQEKTFGPTISGLIHKHMGPERVILWDSKERGGRPDTMKILKEAYYTWNAEGEQKNDRVPGHHIAHAMVLFLFCSCIYNLQLHWKHRNHGGLQRGWDSGVWYALGLRRSFFLYRSLLSSGN